MTKFLRGFSLFALIAVLACGFAFAACGGKSDDDEDDKTTKDGGTQTTATYTVTFEYGNGDSAYTVEVTEGATVSAPADPEWDGYMFSGWYADSAATTEYDFSAGIYANTTIYAGWTERREGYVYITYMWNYDDAGVCSVVEMEEGDVMTSTLTATREGYRLGGWYTEPECVNQYTPGSGRVREDMTLYARWLYGYVFEAEYTDLEDEYGDGRSFSIYSDNFYGSQGIFADEACSNGYYVVGMFLSGSYLYFEIESDRDVSDAVLYMSFAATVGWSMAASSCYNGDSVGTLTQHPEDFDISVNGTSINYDVISYDVSGLSFNGTTYTSFNEYYIGSISLVEGTNIIRLETTNSNKGGGGTQYGFSPFTDYMKIYTDATLTWSPCEYNLNGR